MKPQTLKFDINDEDSCRRHAQENSGCRDPRSRAQLENVKKCKKWKHEKNYFEIKHTRETSETCSDAF